MVRKYRSLAAFALASGLLVTNAGSAKADWNRFRGPNGTGIAEDDAKTPVEWSESKNLRWKVELPGAGVSCPIVVGDKVIVTCYSGYGMSQESPGDMRDLQRHLVCLSATNGDELWRRDVPSTVPEDPFAGAGVPQHGYASHTPTSDGTNVYVFFGKSGVMAFDLDGTELWNKSLGTDSDPRHWGSSSSPIVHEDILVVAAGPESRSLVGLDKKTGEELWRVNSDDLGMVWGTPAVCDAESGAAIVLGAPGQIRAFDSKTGKMSWVCDANVGEQFSSSVVVKDGVVYAIEGRGGGSIAVKAGGTDNVTDTNVVWTGRDSGRFGSPVVFEGRVYFVTGGVANCIDAATGKEIFQGRLRGTKPEAVADANAGPDGAGGNAEGPPRGSEGGPGFGGGPGGQRGPSGQRGPGGRGGPGGGRGGFGRGGGGFGNIDYSSPIIADGKLYYVNGTGDMFVLEAGTEFNQLAVNRVVGEGEKFAATPAISNGAIFVRSNKALYCIAEDQ